MSEPGEGEPDPGEPERIVAAEAEEDLIAHAPILAAGLPWRTGGVFAGILGALLIFVAPHIPGLGSALGEVQEKGVDSSMKVRVVTRGPGDQAPPAGGPRTGYVFVDIDAAACRNAGLGARCLDRAPTEPGLTARIARAVLAARPRVVILDATLWDVDPGQASPAADLAALAKAAREHPASPVIAAAPFRPTGAANEGVMEWDLVAASLRDGAVRFAPAMLWRAASEPDDVVRAYSPFAAVAGNSGQAVPTLPMLAALYAEAGGDAAKIKAVDCRYGPLIGAPAAKCAAPSADPVLQRARALGAGARLVFTLPPLISPAGKSAWRAAAQFQNHYDRYPASQAFSPEGALLIDPGQLAGKIVVISASAPTALDFHATPSSARCRGLELVLNAVAAMLGPHGWIAEPHRRPARAWHEAGDHRRRQPAIPDLLAGLLLALAHSLRVAAAGPACWWASTAASDSWSPSARRPLLAAAITPGTSVEHGLANGFASEFFSPILALSRGGFAEGARWLVDRIESGVDRLVRRMPLPKRA